MANIAKTAFTLTNKILEHTISEVQIEEKVVKDWKTSKALIEITYDNTLKTKYTKQPQKIMAMTTTTPMMNFLY